jgi:putative transposase
VDTSLSDERQIRQNPEFMLSERRNAATETAFFTMVITRSGWPDKGVIDKNRSNAAGLFNMYCLLLMHSWCWLVEVPQATHLSNIIAQDSRFIKNTTCHLQTSK